MEESLEFWVLVHDDKGIGPTRGSTYPVWAIPTVSTRRRGSDTVCCPGSLVRFPTPRRPDPSPTPVRHPLSSSIFVPTLFVFVSNSMFHFDSPLRPFWGLLLIYTLSLSRRPTRRCSTPRHPRGRRPVLHHPDYVVPVPRMNRLLTRSSVTVLCLVTQLLIVS